jgi:ribosomal protein L24
VKKHVRSQGEQKGGIFSREAPIHVSNVALLDPKDQYVLLCPCVCVCVRVCVC